MSKSGSSGNKSGSTLKSSGNKDLLGNIHTPKVIRSLDVLVTSDKSTTASTPPKKG